MFVDLDILLPGVSAAATMVAAIAAAIAVWQTRKQLKISNKQSLFELRAKRWIQASSLIDLYGQYKGHIKIEDSPFFPCDRIFGWLTNNSWLEMSAAAMKSPLQPAEQKILLTKIEELKSLSMEIGYLFEGDIATTLRDFVSSYAKLLHALYRYQIILLRLEEAGDRNGRNLEEAQESVNEPAFRKELSSTVEDTTAFYNAFFSAGGVEEVDAQITLLSTGSKIFGRRSHRC